MINSADITFKRIIHLVNGGTNLAWDVLPAWAALAGQSGKSGMAPGRPPERPVPMDQALSQEYLMRFLPTAVHGVVDYLAGIVFIALPWLFDWNDSAKWILTILGAGVILYSLLTNYELGVIKVIPMGAHLMIDLAGGVVLIVAPFIFDVQPDAARWTMVVLGVLEIGASLMTRTTPANADTVRPAGRV